ncbi:MAG TPA: serine hydrolase domain-containing protein [Pyrinomonadaceae bacterium]|nr:serine hydrolase domain-containing protein [Pyrinomonadaceae bacterium]
MASRKAGGEYPEDDCNPLNVDLNAPPINPQIDKIVNRLTNPRDRDRVPGVAVMVRKGRKIVHLNCYGYANLEAGTKIRLDTIFDLGSLSKQFTAVAVLDLVIKNKLSLTDPLSKFFKGFPRYADAITIDDLIHHTSGLPDYSAIYVESRRAEKDWYHKAMATGNDWYPQMPAGEREITNRDVLKWIATQTLLPRPPDTEYEYCNSGYVVLAELVARVTKKRLHEYLKKQLFDDLGMRHTYVYNEASRFSPTAPEIVNHARCYNRVSGRFVPVGYTPLNFITGDGNMHSTIVDLAKWDRNLHELEVNPVRDLLWSPSTVKSRKRQNYGAGWKLLRDKYEEEIEENGERVTRRYVRRAEYHRGIWLGWRSFFVRGTRWLVTKTGGIDDRKKESLGIIVLSNAIFSQEQFTTCRIAQEISRLYWRKSNIMNKLNCEV